MKRRRVTKAVAHELGWTKVAIMASYLTKSSAANAELVEIARTAKANDLKHAIERHLNDEPHEPRSIMALQTTERQRQMIETALLRAGAHRNNRGGVAAREEALLKLLDKARAA